MANMLSCTHIFHKSLCKGLLHLVRKTCTPRRNLCLSAAHLKNNLLLMGSPGAGKTTIGKNLAEKLCRPFIDVDNDFLEIHWDMLVADKLLEVGGDKFIEEEGNSFCNLTANDSIISLSGSIPMHRTAAEHMKSLGTVIFLDVSSLDIEKRLEKMKVDRIVGQGNGIKMSDILSYRQQFYEGNYDLRVICGENDTPETIAKRIVSTLDDYNNNLGYTSTRACLDDEQKSFLDVVLEGLGNDGGLYVRKNEIPHLDFLEWKRLLSLTYAERALRILEKWIHPSDLHPSVLMPMLNEAYSMNNFNCKKTFPVIKLNSGIFLSELFHGPTASFKDAALQLMPQMFSHAVKIKDVDSRYLMLVATSGDTGSAVLDGFSKYGGDQIKVMVLYPEKGISDIQKVQMTLMDGKNLRVIGVNSDFDFCQSSIKNIFADPSVGYWLKERGYKLSAANSINWGRLLPQVVYHCSAYLDLVDQGHISLGDKIDVTIPTGNFGNILAAFYAKKMGIPIKRLICASNKNNILTEFFKTGHYNISRRSLHRTNSPAIDILKSSNLERYIYYHLNDNEKHLLIDMYKSLENIGEFSVQPDLLEKLVLNGDLIADWCSEEDCQKQISDTFTKGYLLDPHTAVAVAVGNRVKSPKRPMIITSTAHYAKFDSTRFVTGTSATDFCPKMHWKLREIVDQPHLHSTVINASLDDVVSELKIFLDKKR